MPSSFHWKQSFEEVLWCPALPNQRPDRESVAAAILGESEGDSERQVPATQQGSEAVLGRAGRLGQGRGRLGGQG